VSAAVSLRICSRSHRITAETAVAHKKTGCAAAVPAVLDPLQEQTLKHEEVNSTAPGVRPRRQRVRTQRRSFVAVFSGLAAFAALQLALSVVIEIGMPELHDPLYGRRLQLVQKALHADPAKPATVIMLGTSRTLADFLPGPTEKTWGESTERPVAAFNFGVAGCGHLTELLTWRRLQQDGVRPDLLLVEVMPVLLCSQTPFGDFAPDHWPTTRLRWRDLALVERYTGTRRPGLRQDWLTAFALPCYSQRCSLTSFVAPDLLAKVDGPDDQRKVDEFGGLTPLKTPTPEDRRRFTQAARDGYKPYLNGFRLGGPQCEALRELLASCRQEGVPVALVLMPEGPTFRSWYSPETLRDVREWVNQLGAENAAPVIDAREWMVEDDFRESNHLLPDGAVRFTDRLGRETIRPLLRRLSEEKKSPHGLAVRSSQS
jgi:hypothetical protein